MEFGRTRLPRCFRVADRGTLAALPQSCYQLSLPAEGDLETASATNVGRRRRTVSSDPSAEVQERALRNDEDLDAYFLAFPEQAVYRYSGGSTPSSSHVVVNFGTGQNTTLGETIGLAGPILDVLVSLCFRGNVGRGRPPLILFFSRLPLQLLRFQDSESSMSCRPGRVVAPALTLLASKDLLLAWCSR